MTVSDIAGDFPAGVKMTTILKEGAITLSSTTVDKSGGKLTTLSFATPLEQGDIVIISTDTANTYAATDGLPVATQPTGTGALLMGRIVSTPTLVKAPSASQDTWATMLAGEYYRIATVEWFGLQDIIKATLVDSGENAVVPGVVGTLKADVSATVALGDDGLSLADAASGGTGLIPLHYSNTAGTFSILVGVTGVPTWIA